MKTEKFQMEVEALSLNIKASWGSSAAKNRRVVFDRRRYRYTFYIPERRHIKDRREAENLRLCS